jgi:hypothetical protein
MLCYATITLFAMLASQWHANHARHTKILIVEFPETQKLMDNGLLLSQAAEFWDKSRLVNHCTNIEVSAKTAEHRKSNVGEGIG